MASIGNTDPHRHLPSIETLEHQRPSKHISHHTSWTFYSVISTVKAAFLDLIMHNHPIAPHDADKALKKAEQHKHRKYQDRLDIPFDVGPYLADINKSIANISVLCSHTEPFLVDFHGCSIPEAIVVLAFNSSGYFPCSNNHNGGYRGCSHVHRFRCAVLGI